MAAPQLPTSELLRSAKAGDPVAREQLLARYIPRLRRWASGRLPRNARSLFDTADLVQETLLRVLQGLDRIELRGPGGFQAYVRQAIHNRIRDEMRWSGRRPDAGEVLDELVDIAPSPLEELIGSDVLERFESALARLSDEDQELLHLRLELDFGYAEIAAMTGRPSPDAARVAYRRSLGRLAEAMERGG